MSMTITMTITMPLIPIAYCLLPIAFCLLPYQHLKHRHISTDAVRFASRVGVIDYVIVC